MRWLDLIENDLRLIDVCVEDIENRDEWNFRTRVTDPKLLGERRRRRSYYVDPEMLYIYIYIYTCKKI
jgi:hypothetical protein